MDVIQDYGTRIAVQGEMINNLRFTDDIDLVEESCVALQNSVKLLSEAGIEAGLRINTEKTKIMIFGKEDIEQQIGIMNNRIENVKEFVYLESVLTWDNDCSKDIRARINFKRSNGWIRRDMEQQRNQIQYQDRLSQGLCVQRSAIRM